MVLEKLSKCWDGVSLVKDERNTAGEIGIQIDLCADGGVRQIKRCNLLKAVSNEQSKQRMTFFKSSIGKKERLAPPYRASDLLQFRTCHSKLPH